jgi:hypothetical protein
MHRNVTVRSFGGNFVHLVAVEDANRLVYVANPQSLQRIAEGLTEPVGVPKEDVMEGWDKSAN